MKKTTVFTAVSLVMASLLTSCGGEDSVKDKKAEESVSVSVNSVWDYSSFGLMDLMNAESNANMAGDKSGIHFNFTRSYGTNLVEDGIVSGEYDMAVLPLEQALNAYKRSNASVKIVDINSLSELCVLTNDASIKSLEDIDGKDVLVPDYADDLFFDLTYQRSVNVNIKKCELEKCKSDLEASKDTVISVIPEPDASELLLEEKISKVCSVNEEWEKENNGTLSIDTVTVARKKLVEEHPELVKDYLEKHKASVDKLKADPSAFVSTVTNRNIIRHPDTLENKLKDNRAVFISGAEMKDKISSYLDAVDYEDMDEINTDNLFYIP